MIQKYLAGLSILFLIGFSEFIAMRLCFDMSWLACFKVGFYSSLFVGVVTIILIWAVGVLA